MLTWIYFGIASCILSAAIYSLGRWLTGNETHDGGESISGFQGVANERILDRSKS